MSRFFRPRPLVIASGIIGSLFISFFTISYTNNPPKARTGAPSEGNCTGCHSGTALTSGTEYGNVKMTTNMTNDEYIPDSTYEITISYTESGKSKFGFQTTVLKTSDDTQAGDLVVTSSSTTTKGTQNVNSKSRQYIYHTSSGTSGSGKVSWSFEWDAPSTNVGSVKFYVALNSTNSNSGSGGDKIILKSFEFDPSSKLPEASFKMSNTTACVGDTIELDGTGSSQTDTYKWTISQGNPTTSKDSVVKVVWNKAGTYDIKLVTSNGIGKSAEEKKSITVKAVPVNTVTQTGNDTICHGDTVVLEADEGVSWKWSSGETTQKINVLKSGTYSVEVGAKNGCTSTSSDFEIEVIPPASMNIGNLGNDTLCAADSFELLGSTGFVEYRLLNNNNPLVTTKNQVIKGVLPPGVHNLTLFGTDKFGCVSMESSPFLIDVIAPISAPEVICGTTTDASITIDWNPDTEVKSYEVSLDSGKNWTSTGVTNSYTINGLSSSTTKNFLVRGKTKSPCFYSSVGEVTCKTNNCFKVSFNATNRTACLASKGNLVLNNLNLERFGIAYDGGAFSSDTTYEFNTVTLGVGQHKINISMVDSNALTCPVFDTSVNIVVHPLPLPEMLTTWKEGGGRNRICVSDDAKELKGNTRDVNGPEDYTFMEWTGPGVSESGGVYTFDPAVAGEGSHNLVYEVENIYGCKGSAGDLIAVDGEKVASFTFTADKADVSFVQNIKNAGRWVWSFGDGNTSTSENPTHTYASDNTYTVQLRTDDPAKACDDVSATEEVAVVGGFIEEFGGQVELYPMPFDDVLRVVLPENKQDNFVRVYDLTGSVVFEASNMSHEMTLDLSQLNPGMHLLQVSNGDRVFSRPILKK